MRKQAALLFSYPVREWIKKTPQEVLIIGSLLMIYLLHSVIILADMLLALY